MGRAREAIQPRANSNGERTVADRVLRGGPIGIHVLCEVRK